MNELHSGEGSKAHSDLRDPVVRLCAFYVASQEYVIDLMRVEEILQPPEAIPVPNAPFYVQGVMSLRGAIVPIVDLRKWLRTEPAGAVRRKCLICRMGTRRLAILVDKVSDVVRIRKSEIRPLPSVVAPGANPAIIGVCGPPGQFKLLLNLKALPRSDTP